MKNSKSRSVYVLTFLVFSLLVYIVLNCGFSNPSFAKNDHALTNTESARESVDIKEIKKLAQVEYADRRERVKKMCQAYEQKIGPDFRANQNLNNAFWRIYPYYAFQEGFVYCTLPKVASTLWESYLISLRENEFRRLNEIWLERGMGKGGLRGNMRKSIFSLPSSIPIQKANEKLLSFVFVRHPFERLVSLYYHLKKDEIGQEVGVVIPGIRATGTKYSKTPLEFVEKILKYLGDANEQDQLRMNRHMKPQWISCPFCSMDYDVIGKMETFAKDNSFVIDNLKLNNVLDADSVVNDNKYKASKDAMVRDFFSTIPKNMTRRLYDIYRPDFELFGYSLPEGVDMD